MSIKLIYARIGSNEVFMNFEQKYLQIKNVVEEDFKILETGILEIFSTKTPLDKELERFLTAPSKRLRPLLGFLFCRNIYNKINDSQRKILLAIELIHNATLIHDDVIDKADKRRNIETINTKFSEDLAVVAGDFLLSAAMEKIIETDSIEALKICTKGLKKTCIGEINQYFNKYKITSIEDYIKKSEEKTALLFQIAVLASVSTEKNLSESIKKTANEFALNFGIAFQIRDDLKNIIDNKNYSSDINNGIYTAPIIYAKQENPDILNHKNLQEALAKTKGIEKTRNLLDNYFEKAIKAIEPIEENIYKKTLINLIELLKESV